MPGTVFGVRALRCQRMSWRNTLVTFHPAVLLDKLAWPQVAQPPPWWSLEGSKISFFHCLIPSSSLLLGTNAWHIHMRRGSPSTQQPELFPEAPPPGWPAPVPLVSTCFSQSCPGPSSRIKGHTQLRSKERYWGLVLLMSDLEPAVASLTETCFLIFVFTLNSHFPAHYDW